MNFTHLHVHTEYSLLDGSAKIKELVERAKELGMTSLAITDHGVMYGAIDFYKAAKAAGIKPIIGCEVYVSPGSRFDRETVKGEGRYYHLILLAKNNQGYKNLSKIVSRGFTEGFYYKPRVDMEVLREFSEGIICLSACLGGEIAVNLRKDEYEKAKETALRYNEIFGQGNYYLEMQDHGIPEQRIVNTGIMRLSKETGIPIVATNDSHYINADDSEAHDILLCIQTKSLVTDEDRMRYEPRQFYLRSAEEMEALFPYAKEALENTNKIADMCDVDIVFNEQKVPKYPVPSEYDEFSYLAKLCEEGLSARYDVITDEIKSRLDFELNTIKDMGYIDYFLIVWDFVDYSKKHGIAVGPGRGSAAGSIVSYCLGITDIDPIEFNLLFERFLNPERVTMPDIDIDFCYERRQEVIDYVVEKYGKDKVVQIVTFGTMAAKMCIRDVCRAMNLPYALGDKIAKSIPNDIGMTLQKALDTTRDIKAIYDEDTSARKIIDMAIKLEGLPRHSSIHAAGVVIGRESIDEYVPLAMSSDDVITTQYNMTTIEELGLLKMDFLGLRTLTVIQNAVKYVKESKGIDIDIDKLDFSDCKVYELIASGKTEGVFQLESAGMRNFMKELKPSSFDDVIAGISLYRPGPMDFIPLYIKGKDNKNGIKYDHPLLEKILSPTYGCIVYQEQVMQIFMELAGYTLGRSDLVRRAMSKKKVEVMMKERENFIYGNEKEGVKGCLDNGISEEVATKVFDEMAEFAKYAFNKSHAAAYAVVSYQTAYLKAYYPVEFMAALISSVKDKSAKVSFYIQHCRTMGIDILPPDVNLAKSDFSVSENAIRYGLSAVKSIGEGVTDIVKEEISKNGPFLDMEDYIRRLSNKEANKRTIESFICSGAFDSFGKTRRQMMLVYPQLLEQDAREKKNAIKGQISLFSLLDEEEKEKIKIKYPDVLEYPKEELLEKEKKFIGIYISGHPLEDYRDLISNNVNINSIDFEVDEETGVAKARDKSLYTMGGMIETITIKTTRAGDNMAFVTLMDLYGTVEIVIFPKAYNKYKDIIVKDAKVFVKGNASITEEEGKLLLMEMYTFDTARQQLDAINKTVWLCFENIEDYKGQLNELVTILNKYPGRTKVNIQLKNPASKKYMGDKYTVSVNPSLEAELNLLCGKDKVMILSR